MVIEKPKFEKYQDYMKWRLDRRVQSIRDRADKCIRRYVDKLSDEDAKKTEEDRLWLDQFAIGNGLDIACGDFLCGDAVGVDGDTRYVGADYFAQGDELTFQEPEQLDFIVTNYFEGMPNPLNALNEWWRCLRPGGVLAIVCRNADSYSSKHLKGALSNGSRQNTFTSTTLGHYLYRAGFIKYRYEMANNETVIRATAIKEKQ